MISCDKKPQSPISNSTVIECEALYNKARSLQKVQKYPQAIEVFKQCLKFESEDDSTRKALQPIVVESMIKLMNSFQSSGDPIGCVEYLDSLRKNPSPFIQHYCRRDLYSLLGYAYSRTEDMKKAEQYTEAALKMPLIHPTPQRLFKDYAYAAAVFFGNASKQSEVMDYSLKALDQSKLYNNPSGRQWLTSLLGLLYKRTGKINEAIELYKQSIDDARAQNDLLGEINACNSLADLYLYWKLPEYANKYADFSVKNDKKTQGKNPMVSGQSFYLKGRVMNELGNPDSAFFFLTKADSCCVDLPYNSGKSSIDYLMGDLMVNKCRGDSLLQGIEILKRAVSQASISVKASSFLSLAKGYIKLGKDYKAEAMLDSMYNILNTAKESLYVEDAYSYALNYYLSKRNISKIEIYSKALLKEQSSRNESDVTKKLAETISDFHTIKKGQQLKISQMKLERRNLYFKFYILISIGLITILALLFFYKRRIYKIDKLLLERRLSDVLDNLQIAHDNHTKAEKQLSEIFMEEKNRRNIEPLTPFLLKEKGEPKFRERFVKLYPHFLVTLKKRVPNIGRKEELLCMLIVLGQDAYQIETIMGIAHSSVNMARYRLRQKLELDKDTSLEEAVMSLLK